MAKIWRDKIEPPSTDYIWYKLNHDDELIGTFKYEGGKWVLVKISPEESSGEVDFSSIINGAPEQLDTLGEIAESLNGKVNSTDLATVAFSGDFNDLINTPNERTFKEFKSTWPTETTVEAFCDAVANDSDAKVGNAYLGGLRCSGLPEGMLNGDVVVEIIGASSSKVVELTMTSTNLPPYHWEASYWKGHWYGWKTFELGDNKVTSISAQSTDTEYPSAKCVYDKISESELVISSSLNELNDRLLALEAIINGNSNQQQS